MHAIIAFSLLNHSDGLFWSHEVILNGLGYAIRIKALNQQINDHLPIMIIAVSNVIGRANGLEPCICRAGLLKRLTVQHKAFWKREDRNLTTQISVANVHSEI